MSDTNSGDETKSSEIIVGVDGSESSKAALAWALHQANLSGTPLHVVTAWQYPLYYGSAAPWPPDIDFAADARAVLEKAVGEFSLPDDGSVTITKSVIFGSPALVLENLTKDAALIVVGSRGHGEFAGMLLGSVSEYLATHALCPVLIFRDHEQQPKTP